MPTLARASPERELQRLIRLYLKAETDIINEIGRLRSRGLVDYHAVAALERVQEILRKLETDEWEYVPRMVEAQFYVHHPEARAIPGETAEKHLRGYTNAQSLTDGYRAEAHDEPYGPAGGREHDGAFRSAKRPSGPD